MISSIINIFIIMKVSLGDRNIGNLEYSVGVKAFKIMKACHS